MTVDEPKDQFDDQTLLSKSDAAEYLGIKPSALLGHVREGRLKPTRSGDTIKFQVSELNRLASWYDEQRPKRQRFAVAYFALGVLGTGLTLFLVYGLAGRATFWGKLLYSFFGGCFGLALRAHRTKLENLGPPYPDYCISYPAILIVNAFALFAFFEATRATDLFMIAAFPLAVVLGIYAHPEHWIIPRLLRRG